MSTFLTTLEEERVRGCGEDHVTCNEKCTRLKPQGQNLAPSTGIISYGIRLVGNTLFVFENQRSQLSKLNNSNKMASMWMKWEYFL